MAHSEIVTDLHQKLKREDFSIFKEIINRKNVIAVLGCTKGGKSTLVNYLIGTPLVGKQKMERTYEIVKRNVNDQGPEIGAGVVSCTAIPTVYSFEEFLLVDMPGFDDNRRQTQDIINSVYISYVKYAAKVKFVFVYDLNLLLNDNVNPFVHFLNQIHFLLKNFAKLKHSVVLIFTKDSQNLSREDIVGLLGSKLLSVDGLRANLELVSHLVDTIARLGIFKAPEGLDDITSSFDNNIKEAISECPWCFVSTSDIGVPVSLRSRKLLQTLYNEYLTEEFFYHQIQGEVNKFEDLLNINDYIYSSTDVELRGFLNSINSVLRMCRLQKTFKYSSFTDVAVSIKKILNPIDVDFQRQLEVLADLDNCFLMNENLRVQFIDYYKRSLATAIKIFESLISRINSEEIARAEDRNSLVLYKSGTAVGGIGSVVGIGLRIASIHPVASLIGTALSIGTAGGFAVPWYKRSTKIGEAKKKRILARRRDNRWVLQNMFD